MTTEDRDRLIRIDENVRDLKRVVFGNGVPGLNTRVAQLETSHKECSERMGKPRQWPAIVAAVCAVLAVAWNIFGN